VQTTVTKSHHKGLLIVLTVLILDGTDVLRFVVRFVITEVDL